MRGRRGTGRWRIQGKETGITTTDRCTMRAIRSRHRTAPLTASYVATAETIQAQISLEVAAAAAALAVAAVVAVAPVA